MGEAVLQACLNGTRPGEAHPALPISPYALARDARAVAELGVSSVHVHPRCGRGGETIEAHHVADVVSAIRAAVPAMQVVVPSARWVEPDPDRRVEAVMSWGRLGPIKPDVVAVNVHESGWREIGLAACAQGIGLELGVWTPGDAVALRLGGLPPGVVRIVAEVTVGDPMVALAEAARILQALGPVTVPVLLHGEDSGTWAVYRYAGQRRLYRRIGLEDTLTRPDGTPTGGNADLIEHALRIGPPLWTRPPTADRTEAPGSPSRFLRRALRPPGQGTVRPATNTSMSAVQVTAAAVKTGVVGVVGAWASRTPRVGTRWQYPTTCGGRGGLLVTGMIADVARAARLRGGLVDELVAEGTIVSTGVEAAFRRVPRHLFTPGVPLEKAYANDTVRTKRDGRGITISSVSAPWLQATMLEQAQLGPGMRVLEIGSGGCNAALIAELVGAGGQVTTVDIDPEVAARARSCLAAAGYRQVNVVQADAEDGVPDHAPYDRMIVTAGAWDIPPAWSGQLAEGGRLVVPLRMRGLTRSIVFEREGGHLASRGYELCGFVPMQGAGAHSERLVLLCGEEVGLRLDEGQQVDANLLREALSQPRVQAWSQVTAGSGERFDGLYLWLAMVLPGFCLLTAQRAAVDRGIVAHAWPLGMPTAVDGGSFAYLGLRPLTPDRQRSEFGVYGHGPGARELANRMVGHIQSWDGSSLSARIEAHPVDTPDDQLPERALVIDKKHTRVVVSWPREIEPTQGQIVGNATITRGGFV